MRALYRRLPAIAGRIPWAPLADVPTPVQRAAGLDPLAAGGRGAEVWIKRDDLTNARYGGNKVRKLEWLLGAAAASGAVHLVTSGGIGSNHALATAVFAPERGLAATVVLVPQPLTAGVRQTVRNNLRAIAGTGVRMVLCERWSEATARTLAVVASTTRLVPPRVPFLVWPGGSSPVGVLGYVDAALEVVEQVSQGVLPAPDVHVIAAGTGGTAAGVVAGLHLAGVGAEVVAVRVVERPFANPGAIRWLANAALRRLAVAAHERPKRLAASFPLEVLDDWLGACYGAETAAAASAVETARAGAGLGFDPIYTGKALAALLGEARFAGKRVLVWLTKSSADLAPLLARCPDPSALPSEFHRFFS